MKKIISLITIVSLSLIISGFDKIEEKKINWVSFEKAVELNKKHPRKFIIDVYTDWCGWCKRMDKATYEDQKIVALINEKFYAIKFNAEQKESIVFNNKLYEFKAELKAHELALNLLGGKMAYPSTAFLDEKFNMLTMQQGYFGPDQMLPILKFFGDKIYKKKTWEQFQKEGIK